MPLNPDTIEPSAVQDFLPIGELLPPIVRDCIWRAYASGNVTIAEAKEALAGMERNSL